MIKQVKFFLTPFSSIELKFNHLNNSFIATTNGEIATFIVDKAAIYIG